MRIGFSSRMKLIFVYNQSSFNSNKVSRAAGQRIYTGPRAELSKAKTGAQHHRYQNCPAPQHLWSGISASVGINATYYEFLESHQDLEVRRIRAFLISG